MMRACINLGFCLSLTAFLALTCAHSVAATEEALGVALPYSVDRIDPTAVREPVNRIILSNMAYPLVRINGQGEVVPEIAERILVKDEGRTIEFVVRSNLWFPDGRPVSASEIVESLSHLVSRFGGATARASFRKRFIEEEGDRPGVTLGDEAQKLSPLIELMLPRAENITVRASDEYYYSEDKQDSIAITFAGENKSTLEAISLLPVADPKQLDGFGSLFGSTTMMSYVAPFKVRLNRPNHMVVLEKVDRFYRPGSPRVDVVSFKVYPTPADALSALRAGGVDIIAMPTKRLLEEIKNDPTLTAVPSPLAKMARVSGEWELVRDFWGDSQDEMDRLLVDTIIIRHKVEVDSRFKDYFDLSGSYLPWN